MAATDDTVYLTIGSTRFEGWQAIQISAGIETAPRTFSLTMTERYPGQTVAPPQKAGDPVTVSIGNTPIITGFIDVYSPAISSRGHEIHVMGRGRVCDLTDCSAIADQSQIMNRSVLDVAKLVAAPFGIDVVQLDPGTPGPGSVVVNGTILPQLSISLDDTPWSIIESCSRFATLLSFEDAKGNVILTSVGTTRHASGFAEGINVQSASAVFRTDQRYSRYIGINLAVLPTAATLPAAPGDPGASNLAADVPDVPMSRLLRHDGSPRIRNLVIVSEQGFAGRDLCLQRTQWEAARRFGRGNCVTLTVDSWRSADGTLWTPNQLAHVHLPSLHISAEWLIADVNFVVNASHGKVAIVTLMPPAAFTPAPPPVLLDWQTRQAAQQAGAAQ